MKLQLSSKAKTLEELAKVITSAKVLPLYRFYVQDYIKDNNLILNTILEKFNSSLIVRSSSASEDNLATSNAGNFDSVLNVEPNIEDLKKAIEQVISSYGKNLDKKDEIFIQPMLENVTMSGVLFSSDIDTLSSYYIINYDKSGSTSSVTNGVGKDLKTLVVFKEYLYKEDKNIKKLINASKECENIFSNNSLDIEFAFVKDELYILQVRAIVSKNKIDFKNINLSDSLEKLYKKIKKLNAPHPKILGNKSIFGVMPDWNPAEIIGIKPKALAISLYKEIITDNIWAYQRDNYGYRNLRSFPLLVSFLGVPYIDVRVSFNSFIPKKLHESIALKLANYYLKQLELNSNHHDKVEFEIVFSCYYFGIERKLEKLLDYGFSKNEIKRVEFELLELTNSIIDTKNGLYKKDLIKANELEEKYNNIINSNLSIVDKIYWLIEDCKRYGTLPFAGVARAAFVAVQIINSFVDENIISKEDRNNFLSSINTVSKQLSNDKILLDKNKFLQKYGHLRPGTYDICSQRYDENYDFYFSEDSLPLLDNEFIFSTNQIKKIEELIVESGLKIDFNSLIEFIKKSIEGREFVKFLFTKHLSQILKYIEEFGDKLCISKEDLAFLDIQEIKSLYSTLNSQDVSEIFKKNIEKNREFYKYTQAIKLPSLILHEDNIYSFYLEDSEPNFITLKSTIAEVVDLDSGFTGEFTNKIVCIKSADPGYDYLFSKNIAGLITCYGGANSHMAIRCAELGIPAVIGCGENLFSKYKKANKLILDSNNRQVKILS